MTTNTRTRSNVKKKLVSPETNFSKGMPLLLSKRLAAIVTQTLSVTEHLKTTDVGSTYDLGHPLDPDLSGRYTDGFVEKCVDAVILFSGA